MTQIICCGSRLGRFPSQVRQAAERPSPAAGQVRYAGFSNENLMVGYLVLVKGPIRRDGSSTGAMRRPAILP
ncbi:hypothetical protein AA13594_1390 [Gluconacetobacter azotocaptans DSM 13594]|nr:hypothetical protein AA13594_1390 [Gluconacetobacter azotocaptans DSM 13594]